MKLGKYKTLQLDKKMQISFILAGLIKEAELMADTKLASSKSPNRLKIYDKYIKQRNMIIAGFFAMKKIDEFKTGVSLNLMRGRNYSLNQSAKKQTEIDYIVINNNLKIPLFDEYEEYILKQFFKIFDQQPITITENKSFITYTMRRWRPLFIKHFGLHIPFCFTTIRQLRMLSLIRDNASPKTSVLALFGFQPNLINETVEEAQQNLLKMTKGIKLKAG